MAMIVIVDKEAFEGERQQYVIDMLVKSNNDLEERIRKLEDNKQTVTIDTKATLSLPLICNCDKPMSGLGSRSCLRCGLVLVQQA
jgi:hypothetical protein